MGVFALTPLNHFRQSQMHARGDDQANSPCLTDSATCNGVRFSCRTFIKLPCDRKAYGLSPASRDAGRRPNPSRFVFKVDKLSSSFAVVVSGKSVLIKHFGGLMRDAALHPYPR